MFGWKEDLIYTLFLFWGPGVLLVATLPGILRAIVGALMAAGWLVLWFMMMPDTPLGYALALAPVLVGIIGSREPRIPNPDPPANKLLLIPFLVLFSGVSWMALGPIWRERLAIRQFPPLESVEVEGKPIKDLPAFQKALQDSLSCGDVHTQLGPPLPLKITAGGQRHDYRVVYSHERPGLIIILENSDRQLLYSQEMLKLVERAGVKVPR